MSPFALVLLAALPLLATSPSTGRGTAPAADDDAASSTKSKWKQDRYAISMWVDPQVPPAQIDARFKEIADANFSVHLGYDGESLFGRSRGLPSRARVTAQLAAAEKYGLVTIAETCEDLTRAKNGTWQLNTTFWGGTCVTLKSKALWGFRLHDEIANMKGNKSLVYAALRNWSAHVSAASPGALRFINWNSAGLLNKSAVEEPCFPEKPWDGTSCPVNNDASAYKAQSLDTRMSAFVDAVKPDVLAFDHYTYFTGGGDHDVTPQKSNNFMLTGVQSRASQRSILSVFRRRSITSSTPFWNFIRIMPFDAHFDPTPAQLRWQAFTSLAYGSSGILWYCYWTPAYGENRCVKLQSCLFPCS